MSVTYWKMLALTKWVVSPYAGKKWDMIRLNFTLFQSAIFIIILSLSFCLSKSPLLYKLISLPYTFYLLPLFSCPHPSPFLVMLAFMASTMTPLSMTPKSASVPRLFSRALGLFCQLPCCLEWARLLLPLHGREARVKVAPSPHLCWGLTASWGWSF